MLDNLVCPKCESELYLIRKTDADCYILRCKQGHEYFCSLSYRGESYNKETLTWYMFVDDTVSPDKVYDKLFRHAASTFAKRGIINTTIDITIQRQDGVKWASEKDKQISSWLAKGNVQHLGINEALTYTDGDYIQYILTAQFYEKD